MKLKTQRLYFIILGLCSLAIGTTLVLSAFEDSIVFFYSPSEIKNKIFSPNQRIRLGGLVMVGSVEKMDTEVFFEVTDNQEKLQVSYTGILPDLFREGQGVVAEGFVSPSGIFLAEDILAKHDENYMPPEVADAIKASGEWRGKKIYENSITTELK